jgi:hypothetical protein
MSKTIFNFFLLFVALILAQAVIFNNLILFNCALAFVFIYPLIIMPVSVKTNWAMTLGFLTGLAVDVLSDTQGMNALACTLLAFIRRPMFHLYVPRDEDLAGQNANSHNMGLAAFLKYSSSMVLFYCIMVYVIEAFNFFDVQRMLLRIVASSIFTFIVLYAFDSLSLSKREKKL